MVTTAGELDRLDRTVLEAVLEAAKKGRPAVAKEIHDELKKLRLKIPYQEFLARTWFPLIEKGYLRPRRDVHGFIVKGCEVNMEMVTAAIGNGTAAPAEEARGEKRKAHNKLSFVKKVSLLKSLEERRSEFETMGITVLEAAGKLTETCGFPVTRNNLFELFKDYQNLRWKAKRKYSGRRKGGIKARLSKVEAALEWALGVLRRLGEKVPEELLEALSKSKIGEKEESNNGK